MRFMLMRNNKNNRLLIVKVEDLEPWKKLDRAIGHRDCTILAWATVTDYKLLNRDTFLEDLGMDVWQLA